ncbi:hypothetical protein MACK_000503 [Theileria orientalis]|uniref:CLASP N-terminal domain-containing protein n=1 Tax=Theileria orientalis TaxID=68886 RepID=A0A976MA14_THEOR|nr:hypothetical protein MACK_000503 [Theileria orientalis]
MGCMSSKLSESSDLKPEPNRKRTSKPKSEKVPGTSKSSETSKSKDKIKDKKSTSGSSTKKSTGVKTSSTRSEGKSTSGKERSSKSREGSTNRTTTKDRSSKTKDKSGKRGDSTSASAGEKRHKSSSDKRSKSEARSNEVKRESKIEKPVRSSRSDGRTGGDKADPKKKVVDFIPAPMPIKPRVNSYDERPISQAKNVSTKSWWEVEYESNSASSSELSNINFSNNIYTRKTTNFRNNNNNTYSNTYNNRGDNNTALNNANDRFKRNDGNSEGFFNDRATLNNFADRLSYGKGYGSENVNDADLVGDRDGFVDESRDGIYNGQRRQSKETELRENDEFKSFKEDSINITGGNINRSVMGEIPFCDNEDDTPMGSKDGSTRGGFSEYSPQIRPAKANFFGFNATNDDNYLSHSPFSRRDPPTSTFNKNGMDDELVDSTSPPSRSTNMPFRRPYQGKQNVENGRPPITTNISPRPNFQRPLPLKRGAGMVYRKVTPVPKSPEDVIKTLVDTISSLENSKFNDHLKTQKELLEQILKYPDVFARLDTQLVLKMARKIIEIAGGNRSNLARSSLICLGHMFLIFKNLMNPVVVDAMYLCAKKGVSSSPEHLVLASNFCMGAVCTSSLETKVASMLISLYRNNRAHQILCLSGMVVLMNRMKDSMVRLKNLDDIVDCAVKATNSGGVPSRVASRNILGIIDTYSQLDNHLNACKCAEITKTSIKQLLTKYSDDSKDSFIEQFTKTISL